MKEVFKSRVYTDRPKYADYDAPDKFQAIQGIIATRLMQHPKAICSYSGGADSDIMIDLIERTRELLPHLPPVKYVFFNTGLEMQATKDHVKATSEKYGVEIEEVRPKISIAQAARTYGIPFISKAYSKRFHMWSLHPEISVEVAYEFAQAENKAEKIKQIFNKYPNTKELITWLCSANTKGEACKGQYSINSCKYLLEFLRENPPHFLISAKCCDYCKKKPAHEIEKNYDMKITGERVAEGGIRVMHSSCFSEEKRGFHLKPILYVSDNDKEWYKKFYNIRYSDAYEVYGLTRTGCCGCPISYKAVDDLEKIRPYEPNVVKAAWNIFGASYEYRAKYNAYKEQMNNAEKIDTRQITFDDLGNTYSEN